MVTPNMPIRADHIKKAVTTNMSENQFIKKRQRARTRPFLTLRILLGLILLSGIVAGGFYFEFGGLQDQECVGACENTYSLSSWLLGIALLFGAIIACAAIVGGLVATLKWSSGRKSDTLSSLLHDEDIADD